MQLVFRFPCCKESNDPSLEVHMDLVNRQCSENATELSMLADGIMSLGHVDNFFWKAFFALSSLPECTASWKHMYDAAWLY